MVKNRVLHVKYDTTIPVRWQQMASAYEGDIPFRKGLNFPASFLTDVVPFSIDSFDYVIMYPTRDPHHIRNHEERHARFCMDQQYSKQVHRAWNRLSWTCQQKWIKYYRSLGYPDQVIVDEWQADGNVTE